MSKNAGGRNRSQWSVRRCTLAWVAMLALAVPAPGWAQGGEAAGTVRGIVQDADGRPLPFAQVMLVELGRGVLAGADGQYALQDVPRGSYTLRTLLIGYKARDVRIEVGAGGFTQNVTLASDLLDLQTLVVTATRNPQTKIESSTAITTMSPAEIEIAAPRNTADLMRMVPGFYVESSGGEVGNNLFVRGMPADGSYRYVALMEDGMPVYDATELFFVNADIFVRVDESVERVEAVRGGSSALYGSNAPGGVINFISKTGGPTRSGRLKLVEGTDGLHRVDFGVGGPLGPEWRYHVGGFYRYDSGVRDPGFAASRGGQIRANATREFSGGYLRLYGKYINDRNMFFLPVPFSDPGDPEYVRGFPEDGTMATAEANGVRVPLPGNRGLELPLDDGQRQAGGSVMADLGLDLSNGWSLRNTFRAMRVDHTWNALLPFDLVDAQGWAQGVVDATPGGSSFAYSFTNHDETFGTENGLLATGGLWHIEKPMSNLSNQIQLLKSAGAHDLAVGAYVGRYTADNTWHFNDVLTDVRGAPRFVDLAIKDASGNVIRRVTENGFRAYRPFYVNAEGSVTVASLFASDDVELSDRVRLDLGVRLERNGFEQNNEGTAAADLGGPSDADNAVRAGTGQFNEVSVDLTDWAGSIGLNYRLSEAAALYVRGSRGYKMPISDQYLFSTDPQAGDFPDEAEQLLQGETGLKVSTPRLGLSAVLYAQQLENFPSQDARVVGGETRFVTTYVGKARTMGMELEAIAAPAPALKLNGVLTLQDHEYVEFKESGEDRTGNWVRRIPKVIAQLGAAYTVGGTTLSADWNYVGKRYANNANSIELAGFGVVNGRAAYRLPTRPVTISLAALNALDGRGLTEGNPRLDETRPAGQTYFLARPILPRRVTLGLSYDF